VFSLRVKKPFYWEKSRRQVDARPGGRCDARLSWIKDYNIGLLTHFDIHIYI